MTAVNTVTGRRRAVAPLIGKEARRLARHPVMWLIPVIVAAASAADSASGGRNAGYWYGTIFTGVAFFGPILALFAANLVAGGARRGRAEELLSVTPTTETRRAWAMCLGIALPLAGIGAVATGAMAVLDGVYDIPPDQAMTAGELAQLPLVLAGAGLLGVLAARRLPFTGGVLITFVLATLGAVVVFGRFASGIWWMWWTTGTTLGDRAPVPGHPWLHVAYLVGLCACAAVAAVHRGRTLALVGLPLVAATLAVGWLQLS